MFNLNKIKEKALKKKDEEKKLEAIAKETEEQKTESEKNKNESEERLNAGGNLDGNYKVINDKKEKMRDKLKTGLFTLGALAILLAQLKGVYKEQERVEGNDIDIPGNSVKNENPDAGKPVEEIIEDLGYDSDGEDKVTDSNNNNDGSGNKKTESGVVTPEEERLKVTRKSNGNTQGTKIEAAEEKAADIKNDKNQQEIQNQEITQDVGNGKVKTGLDKDLEATTGDGQAEEKNTTVKGGTTIIQSKESEPKENSTPAPEVENKVNSIAPQNDTKPQASNEITNNTDTSSKEVREATDQELDDLLSK